MVIEDKNENDYLCKNVFKSKNEESLKEAFNNKMVELINILEGSNKKHENID